MLTVNSITAQTRLQPRPYQTRIVENVVSMFRGTFRNGAGEFESPLRSALIESPTGSGKSCMGLLVAKLMQELEGVRVGWVAMRRNLLSQVEAENRQHSIDVEMQTISMFEKSPPSDIDLLIIDEAQHDSASSCTHIHNVIKPKWILGLTATPFRSDRVKLCFDRVVRDTGINQLVMDGYLSEFDHYTVPSWDVADLARIYAAEPDRWGKSIFFFNTVAECRALQELLLSLNVRSEVVTGNSDRESQLQAFRDGRVKVIIGCAVLCEGWNDPTLKTAWVRPASRGVTIQMAGRALRLCDESPVKQIVQCQKTSHPFLRTAGCRKQFLLQSGEWRSLKINPLLSLCNSNVRRAIAQTQIALPEFLQRKTPSKRIRPLRF